MTTATTRIALVGLTKDNLDLLPRLIAESDLEPIRVVASETEDVSLRLARLFGLPAGNDIGALDTDRPDLVILGRNTSREWNEMLAAGPWKLLRVEDLPPKGEEAPPEETAPAATGRSEVRPEADVLAVHKRSGAASESDLPAQLPPWLAGALDPARLATAVARELGERSGAERLTIRWCLGTETILSGIWSRRGDAPSHDSMDNTERRRWRGEAEGCLLEVDWTDGNLDPQVEPLRPILRALARVAAWKHFWDRARILVTQAAPCEPAGDEALR
ncbi:MAG: hypothetical protein GF355_06075 [Candidatus Eisenbacteria bacterium]|nr:hypothetical protein [Candidatus Eisenbacteria bacterium]